jgi:orotidine-5'-phosphate decarboxylase
MTTKTNPIILALDYSSIPAASNLLAKVSPHIGAIKIGMELFLSEGERSLGVANGLPIFLDLKLCDIPTTVAKTVKSLCDKLIYQGGNHFLSVHTYGGQEMVEAAIEAAKGSNVEIVGITALTSFHDYHMFQLGIVDRVENFALNLARVSKQLKTFVCPPDQLGAIRWVVGKNAKLISPGIRFEVGAKDDHKAANTPEFALSNGADYLVVGRPITQAEDPVAAAKMLCERIGILGYR